MKRIYRDGPNQIPLDRHGRIKCAIDLRWTVPDDYYDEWRAWFGRIHRDTTWTCFHFGDILIVGPSKRCDGNVLAGCPVIYHSSYQRRVPGEIAIPGYISNVMTMWGREITVVTRRLVPIELCTMVDDPKELWFTRTRWVRIFPLP